MRVWRLALCMLVWAAWGAVCAVAAGDARHLLVNEIQVANTDQFLDPSMNYGGWVELYNPTDESITLTGLYASRDASAPKMWRLSPLLGRVSARGFKTIWFGHYDTGNKYSSSASKQVNFKLDCDGGTFCLSDASGNIVLQQPYPPAIQRASYARITDGGEEWSWCSTPTPGASNNGSSFADEQMAPPAVDTDSRVFTNAFTAHVSIPDGALLRYTTDGSTPTLTNGRGSDDGCFRVDGATVTYRFRLFKDGFLPSAVVTRTYIYKDKDYYLPIVSVVTDATNLYDNKKGAYTVGTNGIAGNGVGYNTNKNRGWERPVNFEYLLPAADGDGGSFLMSLNQECDFEVCGGWSRNMYAPNASFRLKAGKYYLGQNFLPYPFFDEKPYIKNKSIVIRNGGNDGQARILDAAIQRILLTSGLYIDCQACQPVHVFINGEFMFTYNLREPNNKAHGYSNYGIDMDDMDQFEINGSKGYEQKAGDDKAFRRWSALATLLADAPASTSLYEQICELVDIDEYCNYMAAECYIGCTDWLTNCNNVKGYRSRADGKFHLICMDLDAGFGNSNMLGSLAGSLSDSRYDTGRSYLIDIFLNMLRYEPFRKRFIDAFCLVDGSVFEDSRSRAVIMGLWEEKIKAAEFENQTSALDNSASRLISAISSRGSRMYNFRNYFGLTNPVTIELSSNVEGAGILANGQEVPTGKFAGTLHTPMVLTAQVPAGYRFKGWQQTGGSAVVKSRKLFGTTSTWFYYDQGSLDGQQWNEEGYSTSAWSNGNSPFGYGNVGIGGESDYQTTLDYCDDPNNKRLTYYFRKTIQLTSKPGDKDMYVLTGYVDDGCVVYVNGHEAGRYLMPEGEIHYADFSTAYAGTMAGMCTFTLDNRWLHSGTNVIAVEVHNTHEHSSDIYWTAELVHNTLGENSTLSQQLELDLAAYEGQTLGHVVATYEPVAEDESRDALALPVKVNEVGAGNSVFVGDYFKKNDWIELYNTTDTELDVAGLYLSDKIDNPRKFQIPVSATVSTRIPAHGHLIVWADQLEPLTQLHAPFKLGNRDGGMVLLASSDEFVERNAAYFEAHPLLRQFADRLTYNAHGGDQSAGRYPDGGIRLYVFTRPTIGKPNSRCTADAGMGTDAGIMDASGEVLTPDLVQDGNASRHLVGDDGGAEAATAVACYTLAGTYLGRQPDHLPPGIYLVHMSDGTTRKIWKKY